VKYIQGDRADPHFNLAAEEYVLGSFKDNDYLILWQNDNTAVIGKHQNAAEEINLRRAEELGVTIVRRNTGGGAVYHDMGNLNFSFITDWDPDRNMDYDTFLKPVLRALQRFGVKAEKQGRNDLVVDGQKISGNAQCIQNGRLLHHGTLLVSSDLSMISEVLNVQADKIESKGIKSVRSRVANISEFVTEPIDIGRLMQALQESFFNGGPIDRRVFDEAQIKEIEKLAFDKYSTWEWNFGSFKGYSFKNARRFPGGKVEVHLNVKNGIITQCRVFGDFLALCGVEDIEKNVVGCRVDRGELRRALQGIDYKRFYGFDLEELLECFE